MNHNSILSQPISPIPADNLGRNLTVARPDTNKSLPHVGVVGDTYTLLLSGADTDGRYCLIDMFIPPAGGPPPHRHDFEESFTILDGEIEATFRGKKISGARRGDHPHSGQRASLLHECNQETSPAALHLFACRTGRILPRGGSAGGYPDHASTAARQSRGGSNENKSRRAPPEISHGNGKGLGQTRTRE